MIMGNRKKMIFTNKKSQTSTSDRGSNDSVLFLEERVKRMESKLTQLAALSESQWELLKQETRLDDAALNAKLELVKNKMEERCQSKTHCSNCNQKLPGKVNKCYYCGNELKNQAAFSPFDF